MAHMTQEYNVLRHLQVFGAITPLEALNRYGCFRLAAIVCNLRKNGHNITTRTSEGEKKFAIYELERGTK